MTDNEIIKAKEIIKNLHSYCFLSQTTFKKMGYKFCERDFDCLNGLADEINRQKAEIERLQIRNKTLTEITKNYDWKFSKAKTEAIKEFWKMLKSKAFGIIDPDSSIKVVDVADGDNLVKEMTGEKEREN